MKIAICTPVYDQPKAGYTHSLGAMLIRTAEERPDLKLRYFLRQGHLLETRNALASLAANADAILWIDADMIFPADALVRLVAHDQPIVGCNYVTKQIPPRPVCSVKGANGPIRVASNGQTELQEVDMIGLGFVLVSCAALRELGKPVFRPFPHAESGLGEDDFLWHRLRERGAKIFVDHALSAGVAHVGDYAYTNQVAAHFAAQA